MCFFQLSLMNFWSSFSSCLSEDLTNQWGRMSPLPSASGVLSSGPACLSARRSPCLHEVSTQLARLLSLPAKGPKLQRSTTRNDPSKARSTLAEPCHRGCPSSSRVHPDRKGLPLVHAHKVTVTHAWTDHGPSRGDGIQNQRHGKGRLALGRRGEDENRPHTSGRQKEKDSNCA